MVLLGWLVASLADEEVVSQGSHSTGNGPETGVMRSAEEGGQGSWVTAPGIVLVASGFGEN